MDDRCQVDFYVLARPTQSAGEVACRLAMKAWNQGHRIVVRTTDENESRQLDELMWDYPPGRFLPHGISSVGPEAPVSIVARDEVIPDERDLVINLCIEPVPEPLRFTRLCEIVPAEPAHRDASRSKYRAYRDQGLSLKTHELN